MSGSLNLGGFFFSLWVQLVVMKTCYHSPNAYKIITPIATTTVSQLIHAHLMASIDLRKSFDMLPSNFRSHHFHQYDVLENIDFTVFTKQDLTKNSVISTS